MAADPPLSHLVLAAASVADDLGFVALADLTHRAGGGGRGLPHHRLPHGHRGVTAALSGGLLAWRRLRLRGSSPFF
jgi:hypothetical protein